MLCKPKPFFVRQDLTTIAAKIRGWNTATPSEQLEIEAPEIPKVQNGTKLDGLARLQLAPRAGLMLVVRQGNLAPARAI